MRLTYTEERNLYKSGFEFIAGIDEAGRGPLAGPITVAAVIFPKDFYIKGLKDCKNLTPEAREKYYHETYHI